MIALPGLTLLTGQTQIARSILRTFSHFIDQGMLPNRFPDAEERPEYNTVDATLWYFEALRAYLAATDDLGLIAELFPALQDIIDWHVRGTRYRIKMDPEDGLLYAGEAGVQLTWMDAKAGDWVVTPRIGKPVEINALAGDPDLKDIKAWVADSGEGRWTVFEAVDLDVVAPVITMSLQRRLRSRSEAPFSDRLLAAMRNQFGGHAIKKV